MVVLDSDRAVAKQYAELKFALSKAGRPSPENDIWIAATCLRFDLMLVTADSHFAQRPNLLRENWLHPVSEEP